MRKGGESRKVSTHVRKLFDNVRPAFHISTSDWWRRATIDDFFTLALTKEPTGGRPAIFGIKNTVLFIIKKKITLFVSCVLVSFPEN